MIKKRVLIQIFSLVKEIDFLERTLILLKQNSLFVDFDNYDVILDVTVPISDYLTNWDESVLTKQYFIDRVTHLKQYYGDWATESNFEANDTLKGGLDWFLHTTKKYKNIDDIIIIEPDVVFGPYALKLFLESSTVVQQNHKNYIISPEYVKMWDTSWDIVVNETFLQYPFNYRNTNDPIKDTYFVIDESPQLIPLKINNKNIFKFGGGWFTLYSNSLITSMELPENLEGYGRLDDYIMMHCNLTNNDSIQYKIKNLVINDKHNDTTYYDTLISTHNKKEDCIQKNNQLMTKNFEKKFGISVNF